MCKKNTNMESVFLSHLKDNYHCFMINDYLEQLMKDLKKALENNT